MPQKENYIIQLDFLSRAIERMSKSKDIEEASNEILDIIGSIIDYNMAIIYVIDYDKDELEVLAAKGTNINHLKRRIKFKVGEGVVGWVAREKKAIVLKDALAETEHKVRQYQGVDPLIRSYIAVPLIYADKVVGILSISHSEPDLYEAKYAQIISIIAAQIAALIETNKLYLRAQKFSNNILESINSGVIAVNEEEKIITFNREAEKITGFAASEVLGKKLSDLPLKRPGDSWHTLETLRTGKAVTEVETYIIDRKGREIPVNLSTSVLEDEAERKVGATCIFRDISKIKALQEQMKKAEELATIGRFVAGMTHEIRNPLLPIRTASSILLKRGKLSEDGRKLLKIIQDEAERLNSFMNNLMNFIKPVETGDEVTEISEVLSEIYELIKHQCEHQNILVELSQGCKSFVKLPSGHLKQIFLNLFLNSIDAIGENGRISINIEEKGGRALIYFSDNGCGIPPENIDKIFDPFFTTKPNGTGLGLSVVLNLIHSAGGSIQVKSRKGEGTVFIITLPAVQGVSSNEEVSGKDSDRG